MSRNWTDEGSWGMVVNQAEGTECRNLPTSQSKEVVRKWENLLRLELRINGGNGAGEVDRGPHIACGIHYLYIKLPLNLTAPNNQSLSRCFGGSGIWMQLSWLLLTRDVLQDCNQGVGSVYTVSSEGLMGGKAWWGRACWGVELEGWGDESRKGGRDLENQIKSFDFIPLTELPKLMRFETDLGIVQE